MLKFESTARREKVTAILTLTGVASITLGLAWTVCYWYFDRAELAGLFFAVAVVGVLALVRRRRGDGQSVLLVAHGILVAVCGIALIDAPIAWVPRSAHMFLLPLAAAAAFIFDARERYGSLVFPMLCLAAFAAFATGALDPLAPGISPPVEVREWGARSNITFAIALLAIIFKIHRADVGKRLQLERELGRAVRNGQIELHYQPQVRGDGTVTGVEALARWRHPSGTLLSPDVFIPLAEESTLINEIGLEVLRQACETLKRWSQGTKTRHLRIAVNVSPMQLMDGDFTPSLTTVIRQAGIDPALLELELTESALSTNASAIVDKMRAIEALGISWALDDFGTGYSSLATLRQLPVRKLKIDRQFVQEAAGHDSAQRLLGKIIEISQIMQMSALAEGVESVAQRDLLIGMGCDHFQGYLFARPMPESMLEDWLDAQ
ncbi:EAL domain-containing protein [Luteimonas sp. 3794]|uniref:putative bifunctional diguanylate cyclase/phosphodiesterase n=1 Tax=Luteimonas sp. 3794 TaxID=2817730 RepID=UPI00285FE225|nr:EAL domain-containing protein [Luteimonas sp. 3794]MDR6990491.1 EAL domain-containing protein (putative c-di-GMP-specific phosphodiesterase class I) [Luteimonas sp. 3794]